MDSEASRVSLIKELLEQRVRQDQHSEERREKERLERLREIRAAPPNDEFIVGAGARVDVPTRTVSYTRRPTAHPSPPLSPSELPCSYPESLGSRSFSSSRANAPSSPQSPTEAGAFTSQAYTEESWTGFGINGQAGERVQAELNNVKNEIEQIKQLREESDRQITELKTRLNEALLRVEETEGEIERLRSQLRDARAEEMRLNDAIDVMRVRERQLMDQIHTARVPRQDEISPQSAPSIRSGDDRNRRSSHGHRRKSSAKKGLVQVREVGTSSWKHHVL